jgi:hypothetical protein
MFKPLLSEILDQIDSYLTGASSDRQLEGWIVANLQRFLDSGDTEAIRLADEIDASFIEVGEGIIDQTILQRRFDDLLSEARFIPFEFGEPAHLTQLTSVSSTRGTITPGKSLQLVHSFASHGAGKRPAEGP